MAPETLTEYERRRLENIKKNDEMMASLMLRRKAADLSSFPSAKRARTSQNPPKPKPKPNPSNPPVIRRSPRDRAPPPPSAVLPPSNPARLAHLTMEKALQFEPEFGSDRGIVDSILDMASTASKASNGAAAFDPGVMMKLEPEAEERITTAELTCLRFFPHVHRRVVVVGSSMGRVGFWDIDGDGGSDGDGSGVYVYAPHSGRVSGISIQPFSLTKMLTSSYDGFIRLMDVREESFNMIYSSDDSIFSLAQQPFNTGVYFGEGEGYFMGWDERAGKVSCSYKLHDERIDSIDFNTKNTNVMATCSADGTVCLWDIRRINAREPRKLKVHQHDNPVRSAYFSPSGNCLATTSGEYSVRVYNDDNVVEMPVLSNDNQLGTWVSNIRAIWGWDDSYLFVGSSIKAFGIVSVPQETITAIHSPHMNAIPRQFATHPYRHGNLACATGRGQVILWTSE